MERLANPQILDYLRHQGVKLAYLFGSRVRHMETPHSDIDLALLFHEGGRAIDRLEKAGEIRAHLTEVVRPIPLDVVVLNDCGPLLRFEAVIRGCPLLEGTLEEVYAWEKSVRAAYEDFAHIQTIHYREMLRRIGA